MSLFASVFFLYFFSFFFNAPATTEIYTLSLHDALPISSSGRSTDPTWTPRWAGSPIGSAHPGGCPSWRSEEHTSELQSRRDLVCRLLLEKKKKEKNKHNP